MSDDVRVLVETLDRIRSEVAAEERAEALSTLSARVVDALLAAKEGR